MDSQSRKRIRQALLNQGLSRESYTQDDGDGRYEERWTDGKGTVVLLQWGERR